MAEGINSAERESDSRPDGAAVLAGGVVWSLPAAFGSGQPDY